MNTISLSPHQVKEIRKCKRSPEYFADTYCWIQQKASAGVSERTSTIPFTMGRRPARQAEVDERNVPDEAQFFFQRQILRWLSKRENVLTLKSRRVGCSWVAAVYVAWLINFNEGASVAFISETGEKAKDILSKVEFILKNLALHDHDNIKKATRCSWLKGDFHTDNETKIEIAWHDDSGEVVNTSSLTSLTNTDDSGRSGDYTFIVFDELDFYEHPDTTWASATTALTRGGHWMAISTPNQIGFVFHRMCAAGDLTLEGKYDGEPLDYKYIRIHWSEAGINPSEIRKRTVGFTQELIDKEWEWKWITPGTVAFDPTHLAVCYKPPAQYPVIAKELEEYRQKVEAYKAGVPGAQQLYYYSGADTAKGNSHKKSREKDYHAFVATTKSGIEAFSYASQEPLSRWAGQNLDNNGQKIIVEGTCSKLHADWPGFLQIEEEGPGYTTYNNHQLPNDAFSAAYPTTMKHKFKKGAVERFIIKIESHQFIITSLALYQQLSVIQKGTLPGTYAAPAGYNDDLFIAVILAEDARDQEGGMEFTFGMSAADPERAIEEYGTDIGRLPAGPAVQLPEGNNRELASVFELLPSLPALPSDENYFRELISSYGEVR